jgi:hypothetical protein
VANVGAVVRRNEDYGVVISVDNSNFDRIEVEWADGKAEWVTVSEVEWVDSRE